MNFRKNERGGGKLEKSPEILNVQVSRLGSTPTFSIELLTWELERYISIRKKLPQNDQNFKTFTYLKAICFHNYTA